MNSNSYPETTFRDYVRVVFRHKLTIVTAFLAVAISAFIGLKFRTPVYEARVKMLIQAAKEVEAPYYGPLATVRGSGLTLTQSDIVKSNPIIERAVKATKLYERLPNFEKRFASPLKIPFIEFRNKRFIEWLSVAPEEERQAILFRRAVEDLKQRIIIEPIKDTDIFLIKVRDWTSQDAAITANALSRSYVIFDLEQQAAELQLRYGPKHLTVQQLQDNIEEMESHLTGELLPNVEAIGPASVKIIEQATVPVGRVGTPRKVVMMLASLMGLGLGVILAFVFDFLDQTIKSPQEVKTVLGLPLLGSIPKRNWIERPLIEEAKRSTRYVRFYQNLGDQLYLLAQGKGATSVLVTSALRGEGVSTVVVNLGLYLANKAGYRVLVIDGNLRRPSIQKMLKLKDHPGLSDVLQGFCTFSQATQKVCNLSVIGAGQGVPNPVALLVFSRMQELMRVAKSHYDLILIDGANLKEFTDSAVIAATMDSIALVVNEGSTRRQVVHAAMEALAQVKADLIGGIMNRRRFVIPRLIYDWV